MEKFGVGQGVRREEDPRLLKGKGLFVNDVNIPNQAYAIILRSPHAHAEIKSIDISQALKAKGVIGIYTCLLYTSPSPRDRTRSRMPSSA